MRHRHAGLHAEHLRVQRTQAHRTFEALDCVIRFAPPDSQEAAKEPCGREVLVKQQRPVDQRDAAIEIAGKMRQRMAASCERDCVVLANLDGPASQPRTFRELF